MYLKINSRNEINNNIIKYNTNYENFTLLNSNTKENENDSYKYIQINKQLKNLNNITYNKEKFPIISTENNKKINNLYNTPKKNEYTKLINKTKNFNLSDKNNNNKYNKFKSSIKLHTTTSSVKYEENLLHKVEKELKKDYKIRLIIPPMKINKNKNIIGNSTKNVNNNTYANHIYTLTENERSCKKILNKSKE